MKPRFDEGVDALFQAAAALEEKPQYARDAFLAVHSGLARLLASRFYKLTGDEIGDIISEATIKFIRAVRKHQVQRNGAAAYLTTIALHEAHDERRRSRPIPLVEDIASSQDEDSQSVITRRLASFQLVSRVVEEMIRQGESACARVVTMWLDQVREFGTEPSNRSVARVTGVSHPTVAKCLRIFTQRLEELDEGG